MQSTPLRPSLIKAALLLLVLSLLVYFTATSPDSSVWGASGQVIVTFFQSIQFAIGLALGLLLCLAVLIGIFLGAVAMVSPRTSGIMYEGLRNRVLDWTSIVWTPVLRRYEEKKIALRQEMSEPLTMELGQIRRSQAELLQRMDALSTRVNALRDAQRDMAATAELAHLDVRVEEGLTNLRADLEKTGSQIAAITPAAILGDLPGRLVVLEKQPTVDLQPLEDKIAQIAEAVAELQEQSQIPGEASAQEAGEGADFRIFSYIEDVSERNRLTELVQETLGKEMSYAQVIAHLEKNLSQPAAKTIAGHPALIKEYIRFCRKNEQ